MAASLAIADKRGAGGELPPVRRLSLHEAERAPDDKHGNQDAHKLPACRGEPHFPDIVHPEKAAGIGDGILPGPFSDFIIGDGTLGGACGTARKDNALADAGLFHLRQEQRH